MLTLEINQGADRPEFFQEFAAKISDVKKQLLSLFKQSQGTRKDYRWLWCFSWCHDTDLSLWDWRSIEFYC